MGLRRGESRFLAGFAAVSAGMGVILAAPIGVGVTIWYGFGDDPDLEPAWVWAPTAVLLTGVTCVAGVVATLACWRYAAGEPVSGRRAAWWFLAAWVLWVVWGVPVGGLYLGIGLLIYTPMALVVLFAIIAVWRTLTLARPSPPAARAFLCGLAIVLLALVALWLGPRGQGTDARVVALAAVPALPLPFLARRPLAFRIGAVVYAIAGFVYAIEVAGGGGEYALLPADRWALWFTPALVACAAAIPSRRAVASPA